MKRVKRATCGYSDFKCNKPTFRVFTKGFVSDTENYNTNPQKIPLRGRIDNFYNIPRSFQSVISHTPFISIPYPFNVEDKGTTCIDVEDPFSSNFLYATPAVQQNPQYISTWYAPDVSNPTKRNIFMDNYYKASDEGYQWSSQKPGILMPAATMAPFNPIGAIAIPTQALVSVKKGGITTHRSTKSGCPSGFQISVQKNGDFDIYIEITSGIVTVGVGEAGSATINIPGVQIEYFSDGVQLSGYNRIKVDDITEDFKCAIYVIACLSTAQEQTLLQNPQWRAFLYADISKDQNDVIEFMDTLTLPKYALVGNVIWNSDTQTFDITSANCSPIDLRDWVSEVKLPQGEEQKQSALYVFGMIGNSFIKKWYQIKDC